MIGLDLMPWLLTKGFNIHEWFSFISFAIFNPRISPYTYMVSSSIRAATLPVHSNRVKIEPFNAASHAKKRIKFTLNRQKALLPGISSQIYGTTYLRISAEKNILYGITCSLATTWMETDFIFFVEWHQPRKSPCLRSLSQIVSSPTGVNTLDERGKKKVFLSPYKEQHCCRQSPEESLTVCVCGKSWLG